MMCSEICPCYTERVEDPMQQMNRTDAWMGYSELPQKDYNFHHRIFSQARKDRLNITADWPIFEWSFDKETSFESFNQCYDSWKSKAQKDSTIKFDELFYTDSILRGSSLLSFYTQAENIFECSGMCRPALFYHTLPITEGYPKQTCLQEMKQFVDDGAVDFAKSAVTTGVLCLILFILHFGFYFLKP